MADDLRAPLPGGIDIDAIFDAMDFPSFEFVDVETPDGDDAVQFVGKVRRMRTPRGRVLVPVEDMIGLLSAVDEAELGFAFVKDWLTEVAMRDGGEDGTRRG